MVRFPVHTLARIRHVFFEVFMTQFRLLPCFFIACLVFTGCESKTTVTGKVTFDGTPIETGSIVFTVASGSGVPVTGEIKNGDYSLAVPNGSYKVQVMASKKFMSNPTNKSEAPVEEFRDMIPARYKGLNTELTATVDGKPINFDLKSETPKKK
mgnify:CR=1 FL=1